MDNPGPAGLTQFQELLTRLINISVPLAFIALTVILFYAGIKLLTSGDEAKPRQAAAMAITWGLMGIVFLVLAWLVLRLIEAFSGVPVTKFCIGFAPYCL